MSANTRRANETTARDLLDESSERVAFVLRDIACRFNHVLPQRELQRIQSHLDEWEDSRRDLRRERMES
ncbi:MAG: hypothetical protein VW405_13200 [Rhodospirillaceae bacterium]